jgi:hypothetical protein
MINVELVEGLGLPEASERRFAAQEIGESGDPEAAGLLLAQLRRESSRAVKEAILRGLSHIWSSSPVDSIIELLRDEDPFVRAEAADMLQRRAGDAIEGLHQMMQGEDKDLRKFSIDIISQTSVAVPDALYLAALKDDDINVVISAIENLGAGRRIAFAQPVLAVALETTQPMAVCACLETLALIGDKTTLDALRVRFPEAAKIQGIYLQSFLKLLGKTAGPEAVEEICAVIVRHGAHVHAVAIDALAKISARHQASHLSAGCEGLLCGLLGPELDHGVRFHLVRLLGRFAQSSAVAHTLLPLIDDPDRLFALAVVESLAKSSDPAVESALLTLQATENDPQILEELEELLRRRPRWNSPLNSSPN